MRIDIWQSEREKAVVEGGLRVLRGGDEVRPTLMMWKPKAIKPFINAYFRTVQSREEYLTRQIEGHAAHIKAKEDRKAAQRGTDEQVEQTVKVGDIFHYSWGYDQTNCDYFQVIEKQGRKVTLLEIGHKDVPRESGYSPMSAQVIATPGAFLQNAKPFTKIVKFYGGTPHLSMPHGGCSKWNGESNYMSWYA